MQRDYLGIRKTQIIYEPVSAFSHFRTLNHIMDISVQFSHSVVSDFATPWTAKLQASLSITNSWSFLKLMSIESVMPSNRLILCHPLRLPSIFPSIRVFSNESVPHIRWPKYWSFCYNISPSNQCSGLISFRIDWFYLLAVQGTLKINADGGCNHEIKRSFLLGRKAMMNLDSILKSRDITLPTKVSLVVLHLPEVSVTCNPKCQTLS